MSSERAPNYRAAVIGCGTVSQYGHLPAIAASDRWELAAVCDVNPQALQAAAKQYQVKSFYTDPYQMLTEARLDAVVIATHVDTHASLTVAALERGLHVLCEKPMASTLEQCQSIGRASHAI